MQRKKKIKRKSEGAEGLPGAEGGAVRHWSVGFTGGAVVPTAAPSGATVSYCSATFFRVPCCAFVFSVPSRFLAFLPLSVGFSVSLFSVSVVSLLFSLFGFFFVRVLSPSLPLPLFFFFFFSVLPSIYRAKGRGFLWLHMGSKGCGGWSAICVQLSRFRSLFFG